jgi:hypothetical protein
LCTRRFQAVFTPLLAAVQSLAESTHMLQSVKDSAATTSKNGGGGGEEDEKASEESVVVAAAADDDVDNDEANQRLKEVLTPHEKWCLQEYRPLILKLMDAINNPEPPVYKEIETPLPSIHQSNILDQNMLKKTVSKLSSKSSSSHVNDFVCYKCGLTNGSSRYRLWDECLSHVRMNHPEIETRRKDSKAAIRDQCRLAARNAVENTQSTSTATTTTSTTTATSTAPASSSAAGTLSSGSLEFEAPNEVWQCFLQLQKQLFKNAEERTHELMSELSPRLAALASRCTHLTLPTSTSSSTTSSSTIISSSSSSSLQAEAANGADGGLRLVNMDDLVTMITTKTRPKQISMHTADGKRRSYLLKVRVRGFKLDHVIYIYDNCSFFFFSFFLFFTISLSCTPLPPNLFIVIIIIDYYYYYLFIYQIGSRRLAFR